MSPATQSDRRKSARLPATVSALILAGNTAVMPARAEPTEPETASHSIEERIRTLERKLERRDEEDAAREKDGSNVSAGTSGFGLRSASGDYSLNLRLLTQFDGRYYLGSPAMPTAGTAPTRDSFLFRRIEPTINGSLGKLVGYNLTLRFDSDRNDTSNGVSSSLVQDVYVDLRFDPRATLRLGKWKEPLSLENLQYSDALPLIERGYPTGLTGNRDYGIALWGHVFDDRLFYRVGVFNGATDGLDGTARDTDGRKEFIGRLFAEPFKNQDGALRGLGFGIAGSIGTKHAPTVTPAYLSPGQITVFKYNGTTIENGRQTRLVPQASYYRGAFGLVAEFAQSRQDLSNGANRPLTVDAKAYELTASWVLTGENASYAGVKPRRPFAIGSDGWGAFELAARHGVLGFSDEAFDGATPLADPTVAIKRARTYAAGLNWYLTRNVRLASDFNFTRFEGGATNGNRRPERALFTRAQLSF